MVPPTFVHVELPVHARHLAKLPRPRAYPAENPVAQEGHLEEPAEEVHEEVEVTNFRREYCRNVVWVLWIE